MGVFDSVRAVMFDLDNTLIVRKYALRKLARYISGFYFPRQTSRHAEIEELFCECFINGYNRRKECFERFKEESGMDKSVMFDAFLELWNFYYPYCTVRDPGAEAVLLLRKRGYGTSILTNGEFVMQNSKIDVAGIREWFSPIITTQEIGVEKPNPRSFLIACEKAGFAPKQVAYVGDYWKNDICGAAGVGMRTVWYSAYSPGWDESAPRADAEIDSLWKLLDIFCQHFTD